MKQKSLTRWCAVVGFVLAGGITGWAAPILKDRADIPDQMRSLANIRQIHLEVFKLPKAFLDAGVREDDLRSRAKELLAEAGITTVPEDVTPKMSLMFLVLRDPAQDERIPFVLFADVQQKVRVHRLGEDLVVPTSTIIAADVVGRDELADVVMRQTALTIGSFIRFERQGASRN